MALRRVRIVWSGVGAVGYTSLHFLDPGENGADDAYQRVVDFVNDTATARPPQTQAAILPDVETVNPATGEVTSITSMPGETVQGGAAAQDTVPDACQVLCRLRTAGIRSGRRVRGRFFVPHTAEQFTGGGDFAGTAPVTYANALNTLIDPGVVDPVFLAVWSRPRVVLGGAVSPGVAYEVADGSVWNEFAVMRSRRG